jgi:Tfp pilus assembly protein PilV
VFNSICNKKGISLIEVVIALLLTAIGIVSLLTMQPQAWRTSGKSDYLGKAAGILQKELETNEAWIMNPCNAVTTGAQPTKTLRTSGEATARPGDVNYTVDTSITSVAANVWRVKTTVTWAGNSRGISESLIVTRQETFRYGCT